QYLKEEKEVSEVEKVSEVTQPTQMKALAGTIAPSPTTQPTTPIAQTDKYAYVIGVLLEEGAFDLAKQFIDHIQKKQAIVKEEKTEERKEVNKLEA
ncbi:hypothetical protein DRP07_06305, partial [Archaeoglobales archaeon]